MVTILRNKKLFFIIVFIAVIFCLFAIKFDLITASPHRSIDPNNLHGTLLTKPRPISHFELTDDKGRSFTNNNLKNHWTFLFFGFTHCGYICPTTMAVLNNMYNRIEHRQRTQMPQVVFISIDPRRDTIQRLRHYVTSFNKAFIGARAEKPQIDAMTRELNIVYLEAKRRDAHGKPIKNYQINHSGALLLVNPAGQLAAVFTVPHHAENLAHDYELITQNR